MSKELIRLVDCTMAFDDEVVLDNITLNIHNKEFLTLLGPSGCGKTTTLRIIGGFQTPTAGDVFFDGVRINAVPAHKRAINTVFQRYALFPHLNVFENIAFGLRIPKAALRMVTQESTDPETGETVQTNLVGVYTLVGGRAEFKPVEILTEESDFYVVSPATEGRAVLRAGDEVIISAYDLYDGKVIT